jgi:hypothetical protein
MVPVDYVCDVIERVAYVAGASGRFHAVAAEESLTVAELIDEVCRELDRPRPILDAPESLPEEHPAGVFAPYFDVKTRFDDRRTRLLTRSAPDPVSYLPQLLEYGAKARWGKRPMTREAARALAGVPA